MNIYDLISRAQKLRKETQLDSVSPDRVGGLHEDTLKYINEFQLLASSPSLHKAYASVSAMQSDKSPKSDLTGKPLKPGQLVVIVPANQTDATAGDVYRYDGPSGNTSAWTFVAKIGAVPADAELSATSTNPPQNKVVTEKLTELESDALINAKHFSGNGWTEVVEYIMYPEYEYEFRNTGNNTVLTFGVQPPAGYPGVKIEGFPENGIAPGESAIVRSSGIVGGIRFYFSGYSSLLIRTLINVDKEIIDIKQDYNEKINNVAIEADSPFSNADIFHYYQNYAPTAIQAAQIIVKGNKPAPKLGLSLFWKDLDGNWYIRISEMTSEGNVVWGNWSKTNYVPDNPENDWISITNGEDVVRLAINWDKIQSGEQWSSALLTFKKECYTANLIEEDAVIKDDYGTMGDFIDGIIDAKYFAKTYEEYSTNKFVLAYFWKNYGEDGTCLIRVRMSSPEVNDNYASISFNNVSDTIEEYTFGEGRFYFKIDWSKIPNNLIWNGRASFKNIILPDEKDTYVHEGYSVKDSTKKQVWVSQDGSKDFTSIGDAYAAITDSSYNNQYEIVVCPGTYDEYNLMPPAFTHTYGLFPNTVKVTSKKWANQGDTLPVFDQRNHSSKLSNMTIESWTGYCVHYDYALNNASLKNENLHLIKQHYSGAMMSVIGGGSFKNGARYEWKSCIFECVGADGNASCHTQANTTGDNTFLIFDACSFIRCSPRIGSVGAFGKCTCEITNCNFAYGVSGLDSWFSPIRSVDNPEQYLANRMEWGVIGGGNKNFSVNARNTIRTIRLVADYPIAISGNAVDAIFGNNYQTNNHKSARIKCTLTSMYYIDDTQAGMEGYSSMRDVYQLWKRLGDCSEDIKTLSVNVNGVVKTCTFDRNYLLTKMSEDEILNKMARVLTNVVVEKYEDDKVGYDFVNTTDKVYIPVAADDILAGEFITKQGTKATSATPTNAIVGMVVKDTVKGDTAPVWTSAISLKDTVYSGSGDIGLNDIGELYWTGADKPIGFIQNWIFYPYY